VRLDQRLETQVERLIDQRAQGGGAMQNSQQQHGIGAQRTKGCQLAPIDHELLGQHRQADRGPHRPQVIERAAEPVRLAQH
jgi:hypothetical protein